MIITSIVHWCPNCHSTNIVKNGHTRQGNQRCLGSRPASIATKLVSWCLNASCPGSTAWHTLIEKTLRERLSLRGIARIFGIPGQTVLLLLRHLAQALPAFRFSVAPAQADDVLELDEMHSFGYRKRQKRWLSEAISLAGSARR